MPRLLVTFIMLAVVTVIAGAAISNSKNAQNLPDDLPVLSSDDQSVASIVNELGTSVPHKPEATVVKGSAIEKPTDVAPKAITPSLSIVPSKPIQGDPLEIIVKGVDTPSDIRSLTLGDKTLDVFEYNGKVMALVPIDLREATGTRLATVVLADGSRIKSSVVVAARPHVEAPLGIPEKLGGNTPESQLELLKTLAEENRSLSALPTASTTLWTKAFEYPLPGITVTDPYGYSRLTGQYEIAHKGTDFRASVGTPVMAMNDGVVRVARAFRDYGNTIVIDHGLGLMTFYMHLSRMDVPVGALVKRGQVIGLSGMTGYAEAAHLHITVRIDDVSIDPMTFMGFFE